MTCFTEMQKMSQRLECLSVMMSTTSVAGNAKGSAMQKNSGSWFLKMIGIATLWGLPMTAATFTVQTDFPCQGAATKTAMNNSVSLDTGFVTCATIGGILIGQGGSAAAAAPKGIGVGVEMLSGPFGQIGQATGIIDTTFTVLGPGVGPISISINFELSGFLGGGTSAGQVSFREIYNEVNIGTRLANGSDGPVYRYFGKAEESFNFSRNPGLITEVSGDLAPAASTCLRPDSLTPSFTRTPVFQVFPGQQNSIQLLARAKVTSGAGSFGNGIASFLNTFKFDPTQQVFNLPDGYTVEVEGMNVVNNRVVDPNANAEVPEPSTYLLAGSALSLAILMRRR